VLTVPQGRRIDEALDSLDFCVAVDYYINESTRHADVILPPTTALEREEFDLVFPAVSVRNHVRYGERVIEPEPNTRSDADILRELLWRVEARTLGKRRAGALNAARRRLLPRRFVDAALRAGPWGLKHGRRLTLRKVRQHPHGLDLGALHPVLPRRLLTKDKRIRLDHPVVVADWPRLMAALHADGDDSLLLIGRRHLRSNNSWMHNSQRLTRGTNHCAVLVHPDDAAARGIAEGDRVSITTPAGSIEAVAEISESVMAGVVCMPHGWGHASRDGVGWSQAASLPGSSVNDITEDTRFDPLSGNAAVTALPVDVTVAR
jgi:anaerobic selenocysteine-containing dehydrogenase